MNLDARIKKLSDILTCFDIEEAKQFIGQEGYFADVIESFKNLKERKYGILACVDDKAHELPFQVRDGNCFWRYFIPESRLKPEEIKYVQFQTIHDLDDTQLYLGCIITFVNTKFLDVVHRAIINEITYDDNTKELIDITLGSTTYSFESLFNNYQLLGNEGKWIPFGKKVEEE